MAATGDERFNSASFLAAQVDFADAGDLLVFIDDTQIKALEAMMAEQGYLDGSRMAAVFNMLRPKDLIWPYVVNNYLLGKQPFPFDLLYWNSDTTRMPPRNHSFYLREFYQNNRLANGEMTIGGIKLDLSKVTLPIYELATREDHIAPAKSVFRGAKLFGGPVRFVLAGSGHIAGVVNPPASGKYMHWLPSGDSKAPASLEEWLAAAQETAGSWWPDYGRWLASQSGAEIPARSPGHGANEVLEDAPGSYVRG
jgi:polyhydroxyalkanoate synthase